jgi:hypothetical protein
LRVCSAAAAILLSKTTFVRHSCHYLGRGGYPFVKRATARESERERGTIDTPIMLGGSPSLCTASGGSNEWMVQRLPCDQSMNSSDSLCQAVFRAHLCADCRSPLRIPDVRAAAIARDKVVAMTFRPLAAAVAMPRWRSCSAQKN